MTENEIEGFNQIINHYGIFNDSFIKSNNLKREIELYFEANKILLKAGEDQARINHWIDFGDMLYLPYIWNLYPPFTSDFVFVDECQDLSKSQLEIVMKYIHPQGRIMSVGDPQQSIYGFTGADIESFENLKNRTNAHLLSLTGCFRCPLAIVRLAQTIKTEIVGKKNYEGIIDQISLKEIVKYAKPDDLILSRLNVDILNILIEFIELDKKVHIHEDQAKEVISQFKNIFFDTDLSTDLNNELQFKNLINSVRFRSTRFIENNSKKYISNNEKEEYIKIELYELETKLKFITNRWTDWKGECNNVNDILEKMLEFFKAGDNGVEISTIHRAKGIERDRVYIVNFDKLPFSRPGHQYWETVQEKNLQYVAITRAREELYLVVAKPEPVCFQVASNVDAAIVKDSNLILLGRTPLSLRRIDYISERISVYYYSQVRNINIESNKLYYSVRFVLPPPQPVLINIRSIPSNLRIYDMASAEIGRTPFEMNQNGNIGKVLSIVFNNQTKEIAINSIERTYLVEFMIPPPPPPPPVCQIFSKPTNLEVYNSKMFSIGRTPLEIKQNEHLGKDLFVKYKNGYQSVTIERTKLNYNVEFREGKSKSWIWIIVFGLGIICFLYFGNIYLDFINNTSSRNVEANSSNSNSPNENIFSNNERAESQNIQSPNVNEQPSQRSDENIEINPLIEKIGVAFTNYLEVSNGSFTSVSNSYTKLQNEYRTLIVGKDQFERAKINTELSTVLDIQANNFSTIIIGDALTQEGSGTSPETIFKSFLEKLSAGNCQDAYTMQKNKSWEGLDNFCDKIKFGGLSSISIQQVKIILFEHNRTLLYTRYIGEDNGIQKIYNQKIFLERFKEDNYSQWYITRIIDILPVTNSNRNN